MTDTTYMTKGTIEYLNNEFGAPCEWCKEKFGPGELTKYEDTGEMLCEDCTRDYNHNNGYVEGRDYL